MKVGVLTSSRADYGIYKPLLEAMRDDSFFDIDLIVFGSHLSNKHGYTINEIEADGFYVKYKIECLGEGDSPMDVALYYAETAKKFSNFWADNGALFDVVFCLGDRYEMFGAVSSGIPFNITFAHIHGGEKTTGAIDNIYRHSISLTSKLHFVSCEAYKSRVDQLTEETGNSFVVGALSLDGLDEFTFLSTDEFYSDFGINLELPTILCTFHPETLNLGRNEQFAEILCEVFSNINESYQILITLPNADTEGNVIRQKFLALKASNKEKVFCYENLGKRGYFSAMKYCSFLLGNTSSGIIEAGSFKKFVINIGDRQNGRIYGDNVFNIKIERDTILEAINNLPLHEEDEIVNPYYKGGAAINIIEHLKAFQKSKN